MPTTRTDLTGLRTALQPLATAATKLSSDDAAATRFMAALRAGDSAQIARLMEDMGVGGVQYSRIPFDEDPAPVPVDYLRVFPDNQRFDWYIGVEIHGSC
jgi:hypothetical protein